jgi:hypothetical protein
LPTPVILATIVTEGIHLNQPVIPTKTVKQVVVPLFALRLAILLQSLIDLAAVVA